MLCEKTVIFPAGHNKTDGTSAIVFCTQSKSAGNFTHFSTSVLVVSIYYIMKQSFCQVFHFMD